MSHDLSILSTLAVGLGFALALGYVAVRLRLPALLGYLAAGILVGPLTPGFVADSGVAHQLAEFGIMLLMFGVGLHFSLQDLLQVRKAVLPGALVQMAVTTAAGWGVSRLWGWSDAAGLVLGLCLSIASTVVFLKALESRGRLGSVNGKIAMGWLVVEDLATVLVLVLLPALVKGGGSSSRGPVASLSLAVLFVLLMLGGGKKVFPWILWRVAKTGSRELFTLCVVSMALGIALVAGAVFGVSYALGAFLAGMVLRGSDFSHRAAERALPLQEAFSVLFFVSVGMLFDPRVLWVHPVRVLVLSILVVAGKFLWGGLLVLSRRYPLNTALVLAAGISQIGEFSFVLSGTARSLGIFPQEGVDLVLAASLVSITLNSWVFRGVDPLIGWIRRRSHLARLLERPADPLAMLPQSTPQKYLSGQVVLVGYGEIGARIAGVLSDRSVPFVVVDENRQLVEDLRRRGIPAVSGDASDPAVLVQAHIARADLMVATSSDPVRIQAMVRTAKALNPPVEIVSHLETLQDAQQLGAAGGRIFLAEETLAQAMSEHVLQRFGKR